MEKDPFTRYGMGSGVPKKLRKPCVACGGPKPDGARIRYCSDACRFTRPRYAPPPLNPFRGRKKPVKEKRQTRLIHLARSRAKQLGLEFNITREDVPIPEFCPVLGIPLLFDQPRGFCDNSPTLDRIDNTKGYVIENIVIVSWRANRIKCDATIEELKLLAKFYTKLSNENESHERDQSAH